MTACVPAVQTYRPQGPTPMISHSVRLRVAQQSRTEHCITWGICANSPRSGEVLGRVKVSQRPSPRPSLSSSLSGLKKDMPTHAFLSAQLLNSFCNGNLCITLCFDKHGTDTALQIFNCIMDRVFSQCTNLLVRLALHDLELCLSLTNLSENARRPD